MTEKYSPLPINPQQLHQLRQPYKECLRNIRILRYKLLTPLDPQNIKYTQKSQPLVPVDTPLLIIRKHIPRQSDIDKIVKSIETCIIHGLELPIQAQDLIKVYQTLVHF